MTTSGAGRISLLDKWKLLGGKESMAGMLLFGVSTAFYSVSSVGFPAPEEMGAGTQNRPTTKCRR